PVGGISIPRPATLSLALAAILLSTGISLAAGPVVATSVRRSAVAPSLLSPSPRFGALLPLTGALGLYGTSMANAVGLLEEQVNASGGIRGTNLTVYVEDSQTDPNAARAAATDLIQNKGVQAIVGDAYAGGTLAAFPVAQAAGVVMMSPSATSATLSTVDSGDLLWRTTASDRLQGKAAASLAWTNLSYQRIGVLARNDSYGRNIASSFDENFTALGGTVPIVILYLDSATDHTAELTSLFSTNPQAVFLDAYERYRSAYAARFGQEPTLLSENAYDAAFILALAMEAADSTDPTQFRSALRYVANPPGHTILPGQWAEALAALDAGENIDYWGAANRADFDRYGDVGTAYGVWLVDGAGVIRTVAVLDEPIFWTPAPEDPLPPHVAISSPTEGALLSGVSTIRGTANASLGIAAIQVHVDGGEWQN